MFPVVLKDKRVVEWFFVCHDTETTVWETLWPDPFSGTQEDKMELRSYSCPNKRSLISVSSLPFIRPKSTVNWFLKSFFRIDDSWSRNNLTLTISFLQGKSLFNVNPLHEDWWFTHRTSGSNPVSIQLDSKSPLSGMLERNKRRGGCQLERPR